MTMTGDLTALAGVCQDEGRYYTLARVCQEEGRSHRTGWSVRMNEDLIAVARVCQDEGRSYRTGQSV